MKRNIIKQLNMNTTELDLGADSDISHLIKSIPRFLLNLKLNLIQWNINGFYTLYEMLKVIMSEINPAITIQWKIIIVSLKIVLTKTSGGVAIYVNKEIEPTKLILVPTWQ